MTSEQIMFYWVSQMGPHVLHVIYNLCVHRSQLLVFQVDNCSFVRSFKGLQLIENSDSISTLPEFLFAGIECMQKDCHVLVPEDFLCNALSKPELRDKYTQLSFTDHVKVRYNYRFTFLMC
jgi:hypothetical protein